MITFEEIDQKIRELEALVRQLPDDKPRMHADLHLDTVRLYVRQAIPEVDEGDTLPSPSP